MSHIGDTIKAARVAAGISQNALAKRAGIAQATLSAIEAQTKSPNVDTVQRLAAALGCSLTSLLEGAPSPLTDLEAQLVAVFRALNEAGRFELLERAREMAALDKWVQKKDTLIG